MRRNVLASLLLAFSVPLAATTVSVQTATDTPAASAPADQSVVIPAGTKILLSLSSEISTRNAKPGDAVYLSTAFPVIVGGKVALPAGLYVRGYVDGLQRGGKVKGRAQLMMHFVAMIFPNGQVIALPGAMDRVPGSNGAKVANREGLIEQSSNKAGDARTIANTTLTGAGVGALVGWTNDSPGTSVGAGAGAGAAVGVVTTLFQRGNDIVLGQGSTIEMVLQRPLRVSEEQPSGQAPAAAAQPQPVPVDVQQPMPKSGQAN